VRPKKKPAKATQKTIWAGPTPTAPRPSNAPGWNSTAIIAVTSTGEPSNMARVSRLRTRTSALRRVSSHHCRKTPGEFRSSGRTAWAGVLAGWAGVLAGWRQAANRSAHARGVSSLASRW